MTRANGFIRIAAAIAVCAVLSHTAYAAADPELDKAWGEALVLAKDWNLGQVTLATDSGEEVFVSPSLTVTVGGKFLSKAKSAANPHDTLLFALLHELWHVHQLNSDRSGYEAPGLRRVLECAADARAAFTMALQKHAVMSPDAPEAKGERVAQDLDAIPSIPDLFTSLDDAKALSLKHLGVNERRFASRIGVLQALSSDFRRLPKNWSPGTYGRLQRQSSQLYFLFAPAGVSDQQKMSDICSYIVGSGADSLVRVMAKSSDLLQQNGQRLSTTIFEIENLSDWPIRYSFLTLDGVVEKTASDEDISRFELMRRTFVDVPARRKANFQSLQVVPPIDGSKFKYLPFYSAGKLDRVDQIGEAVPPASCFDDVSATVAKEMDPLTKLAVRVGHSASSRFEGVRGEENKFLSNAFAKVYRYAFDPPGRDSGQITITGGDALTGATIDLYTGNNRDEALRIIDRIADIAAKACPASEDPAFPLFTRKDNSSLEFQRFTTGSAASVIFALPDPEDPEDSSIRVYWSIRRNTVDL